MPWLIMMIMTAMADRRTYCSSSSSSSSKLESLARIDGVTYVTGDIYSGTSTAHLRLRGLQRIAPVDSNDKTFHEKLAISG
jgi:hypothetical protein